MKEIIQTSIMEALSRCTNYKGEGFLDKFDNLTLSDFGITIYNAIPLYSDEVADTIIDNILIAFETKENTIHFIEATLRTLMFKFVGKNRDIYLLSAISFWTNILNRYINEAELQKQEEEYRVFLFSHILNNMEDVIEQIKIDDIKAITRNIKNHYIRLDENGIIPTEKTKENFNHLLNI